MSKSKEEVRKAVQLLRELELAPEQAEALDTIERHSGEVRRQIADLKGELNQAKESLASAEKRFAEVEKDRLLRSHLEEKIRSLESHSSIMMSQLATLRRQVPQPIPVTRNVMDGALLLSKQARVVIETALSEWDTKLAENVLLQYAVFLAIRAAQLMAGQKSADLELEEELLQACQRYFDRVAPGHFSYKREMSSVPMDAF